jgi:hypothetical protein
VCPVTVCQIEYISTHTHAHALDKKVDFFPLPSCSVTWRLKGRTHPFVAYRFFFLYTYINLYFIRVCVYVCVYLCVNRVNIATVEYG